MGQKAQWITIIKNEDRLSFPASYDPYANTVLPVVLRSFLKRLSAEKPKKTPTGFTKRGRPKNRLSPYFFSSHFVWVTTQQSVATFVQQAVLFNPKKAIIPEYRKAVSEEDLIAQQVCQQPVANALTITAIAENLYP